MVSEFRRMCGAYESAVRRRERGEESRARFVVRHRRCWYFEDRAPGAPVRLSFGLPVDDALRRTVAVAVSDAGGCRATVAADAVVLRGVVPPERVIDAEIRIEAVLDCESPLPNDSVSEPASTWLADDEPGIPCTDRVRALARAWTTGCEEPLAKLRALWDELERRVLPGFTHPEDAALDPLEHGWADCKTSSSLLVALTRSLGIPARLVSGMLLVRERPSDFHFWMEAWLPDRGWTPFDWHATVSLSALSLDRDRWRYIYFGRLDYRVIHVRYPKPFASITGVQFPASWYREDVGMRGRRRSQYRDAGRRPISTDTFEIEELSWI
jgi:transglutaminase-like putative cysteine protease